MRIILVGPPGVGKGTQAALLETRLGAKPLSSGVIFRAEIEAETDLGRLAQSYINRGELVPNGVTIEMMAKRLRTEEVRDHGFVLDGFPRTVRQAVALNLLLSEMHTPLDKVVALETDEEILIERLSGRLGCTKCGEIYHRVNKPPKREGLCDKCNSALFVRSDDQPDAIRQRLRVFKEQTEPVVHFFEELGMLKRVDANRDPEEVYKEIIEN